jgi:RNA polymerase sigma-70 factor (ECF subfamily)
MLSLSATYREHVPPGHIMTEEALVKAAQSDPKQFEALYNKYFEPVFRFVYQRVEQKQNAADITSQVFLKAMLNLPKV